MTTFAPQPDFGSIDTAMLESSKALLDCLPYPIMWIAADYRVLWTNQAAREHYDLASTLCHTMSHAYQDPCDLHGEPCPKRRAEDELVSISVNHAHATTHGTELFKVTAVPIRGGGVLELHVPLDDVMARDKLTGLHSREFFERVLHRQLALLRRIDRPYAIAMVDLDHFKVLNDTHGHRVGDEALEKVGAAILSAIRDMDTAGRWGGEEFCIYFPATDEAGALEVCERITDAIRAVRISVAETLTASVGLCATGAESSFEQVFQLADQAMYEAKRAGRNRIRVARANELTQQQENQQAQGDDGD